VKMFVRKASTTKTGRYNDKRVPPLLVQNWSQSSVPHAVRYGMISRSTNELTRKMAAKCACNGCDDESEEPCDSDGLEVESIDPFITRLC
jgi:hypothetical protein